MSASEETVEALLGLVRSSHSPWALMKGSSVEDHFLRELAIQHPLMIRDTFFYSYFRSLRVVDKGVSAGHMDRKGGGSLGSWFWGTLSFQPLLRPLQGVTLSVALSLSLTPEELSPVCLWLTLASSAVSPPGKDL